MCKNVIIYKMSSLVKRALPLLKLLAEAKPELKKAIIKYASPDVVKAISEIALNMLKVVIKLTEKESFLFRKVGVLVLLYYYPLHFHC